MFVLWRAVTLRHVQRKCVHIHQFRSKNIECVVVCPSGLHYMYLCSKCVYDVCVVLRVFINVECFFVSLFHCFSSINFEQHLNNIFPAVRSQMLRKYNIRVPAWIHSLAYSRCVCVHLPCGSCCCSCFVLLYRLFAFCCTFLCGRYVCPVYWAYSHKYVCSCECVYTAMTGGKCKFNYVYGGVLKMC